MIPRELLLSALLLSGCGDRLLRFDAPRVAGARSALLFAEAPDGVSAAAVSLDGPGEVALPVRPAAHPRLTALYYLPPLDELGLLAGQLALEPADPSTDIPPPIQSYTAELDDDSPEWMPSAALPESIAAWSLGVGLRACATVGGCVPVTDGACQPCPTPAEPEAPAGPAALVEQTWLCSDGWQQEARSGVQLCAPPSEQPCSGELVQWPSGQGCEPIGAGCDADGFPSDLDRAPIGAQVFVQDGAPAGGDGSRGAPLASIEEAAAGHAGALLVLAGGSYPRDVQLDLFSGAWGCGPGSELRGDLRQDRAGTRLLHGLGLSGSVLLGAGALGLSDLLIQGPGEVGVQLGSGTRADLNRVAFRDRRLALTASAAEATLFAVELGGGGVEVHSRSTLRLAQARIHDLPPNGLELNPAILADGGSHLEARGLEIRRIVGPGIALTAATASISYVVASDLVALPGSDAATPALVLFGGARAGADHLRAERCTRAAVALSSPAPDEPASLALSELWVEQLLAEAGVQPVGVSNVGGSQRMDRASVQVPTGVAIRLSQGAEAQVQDATLGGDFGVAASDSELRGARLNVEAGSVGLILSHALGVLADLRLSGGGFGTGVSAEGGKIFADRVGIIEVNDGVQLRNLAEATLTDVSIVAPRRFGLSVQSSTLVARRARVEGAELYGLISSGGLARLSAQALLLTGLEGTANVAVEGTGQINLDGFAVRAFMVGVHVPVEALTTLSDGLISGCERGAQVDSPSYDLRRVLARVLFRDNETAIAVGP